MLSNIKYPTASLTNGSVSSGLILAVDCHTQKGMGTRRMLIHVSDGGSPVRLSHGKHLSINQSINQSIDQSISQSVDQSINQSINPSLAHSLTYSFTTPSFNCSLTHSRAHALTHARAHARTHSATPSLNQSTNKYQKTEHKLKYPNWWEADQLAKELDSGLTRRE